tara:strand:- start:2319 stop:3347 length:1029 start_codon:yes stop_codon:yes gene_type:complete
MKMEISKMSHGIKSLDVGYVKGDTWHRLDNYKRLDRAPTMAEAKSCFDYEIAKVPSYYKNKITATNDNITFSKIDGGFALARLDDNGNVACILNRAVGNQYSTLDMNDICSLAESQILEPYGDDCEIDTVGTLYNGAIRFLGIRFDEYNIHGDDSKTIDRILLQDCVRGSGIKTLFTSVRTVCDNTRRMALAVGRMIESVQHRGNATEKAKANIIDLANIKIQAKREQERLSNLNKKGEMTVEQYTAVLDAIYPLSYDKDGKVKPRQRNTSKRETIVETFHKGQEGLDGKYSKTPYAFFNAITNYTAREKGRESSNVSWDNVAGGRATLKENALKKIEEVVA